MFLIKDNETWSGIGTIHRNNKYTYEYNCIYKDIKDNKRLQLRAGDIIKIPDHPC